MTEDDSGSSGATGSGGINRRRVLATIGAGAAGLTIATGSASAHQFQFYGCSQVCTDTDGNRAVVATGDGYECRPLDRYDPDQTSDRQNQDWKWTSACYEVQGDESIVGVLEDCTFCVNPNNCASNYYDSVDAIVEDLDCGCGNDIEVGDCDVTGTGGGPPQKAGRPPEKGGGHPRNDGGTGGPSGDGGPPGQSNANGKANGHGKDN